ncbi:hypothetical protein ACFWR9_35480 [Streptomyces sp. NPDC058534]|uniref:hypothetical protein n=1 Tax=Streptomyces sp. NPDC058534 TaxID=3346541 RepID=UPI0036666E27
MEQTFELQRNAVSATHAKSHGIVIGTLTVAAGLPPELAHGMFATPASFDIVLRYASEPGQVDPDTAKRARGAALKVLDVPGEKLRSGWTSQDLLFNTWPILPQGDAATYLTMIQQRDKHAGRRTSSGRPPPSGTHLPRRRCSTALPTSTLSRTPTSPSAFRYGDFVAKFSLASVTPEQAVTGERTVFRNDQPSKHPAGLGPRLLQGRRPLRAACATEGQFGLIPSRSSRRDRGVVEHSGRSPDCRSTRAG